MLQASLLNNLNPTTRLKMWTFNPVFKATIWGGQRIAPFKGIATTLPNVAESWEISDVEGSESTVASGPDKGLTLTELIRKHGAALMGNKNHTRFGDHFPLLIKFIDAEKDLSVQVHPDDGLARRHGMNNGKTEMWYVLDAAEGARLANGFKHPVDPEDYPAMVNDGTIQDALNFNDIHKGDVFYIPAGRVHAIGAGAFVLEIQQTSDATYRIYDYHRKDASGKERELHTELAAEAINFNDTEGKAVEYVERPDIPVNVVDSPFFTTNLLTVDEEFIRDYSERDSFVIIIATEGSALIKTESGEVALKAGDTALIGALEEKVWIYPDSRFSCVETYIR